MKSANKNVSGKEREKLSVKVTRIKNRWHSRLFNGAAVIDEMACELKCDIGWISREMLRWASKLGYISKYAEAARRHQNNSRGPVGKVWHRQQLSH